MEKTSLQAWLEFIEPKTGSLRHVELGQKGLSIGRGGGDLQLGDPLSSEIHAMVSCEAGRYVLRDLSSKNGTYVNGRAVVETELNNLDKIKIGSTQLTFCLAYRIRGKPAAEKPIQTAPAPAPGRHKRTGSVLNPAQLVFHPIRFWRQALNASIANLWRSWPFFFLSLGIVTAQAFSNAHGIPMVQMGFILAATTIALGMMAITCSVFFAFDSIPDAPHRLTQSMRFTFYLAPYVLAVQCAYLIWAGKTHPHVSTYYIASLLPSAFYWGFVALQSRCAFGAGWARAFAFSLTASVPWNLFMTGLMSFTV